MVSEEKTGGGPGDLQGAEPQPLGMCSAFPRRPIHSHYLKCEPPWSDGYSILVAEVASPLLRPVLSATVFLTTDP